MDTQVVITHEVAPCDQYIDETGKHQTITVTVSPTKIVQVDENTLKVQSGCNMWRSCRNPRCFFSLAAREVNPRVGD